VIVRNGTVSSDLPSSAYNFLRDPIALLIYNSFTNPDFGSGTISTSGTIVNTSTNTNPSVSFNFLYNKLPDDIIAEITKDTSPCPSNLVCQYDSNTIAISELSSCTLLRGYKICYYDGSEGNLTLTDNYTIPDGDRIILFVDNAEVTISGKIVSQTRGRSSFVLISENDINIDPTVGGPIENPPTTTDLEGVFYTDSTFDTGHTASGDDLPLHIRGSVVADNFNLVRNIGSGVGKNNTYPAEYFEYGTDQVLAFPPFLRLRTTSWEEVQP
jgi:hypothetical protein